MSQLLRRIVITIVVLAVLAFCGCTSDSPSQPSTARISDVGEYVTLHVYPDGKIREFTYDGVTFLGNMTVAEYERALAIIEPFFLEREVVLLVANCREFPPSQANRYGAPANGFSLRTCTMETPADCDEGRLYSFGRTSDGYGLLPILNWVLYH